MIYKVYVMCISFANLLFMFITFVLIENYVSTGIIRGFEEYIRIQEGQLRIYLVLNLTGRLHCCYAPKVTLLLIKKISFYIVSYFHFV